MSSEVSLKRLETLKKKGKIIGYQETEKGFILLIHDSFSDLEVKKLGINIARVVRIKGRLRALEG